MNAYTRRVVVGLKEELKREMRNVMKDVEKEVDKTWKVEYKGHRIEIINRMKEEFLMIDGVTVDQNKRKSLFSYVIPHSKLFAILELEDGTKHRIAVKLGSYFRFNCIVKIDNQTIIDDSVKLDFLPWDHKEKIIPFIQQQLQVHNKIVNDDLPDDEYIYGENNPRIAAGLSDHLVDDIPTPFHVKQLLKIFEKQLDDPTIQTRKATYEKITSDQIASYSDKLIGQFQQAQLDESLVQQEALWLLNHAAHREVVKFSIIVLGCTDCEKYKELLFKVGLHEEFTSYVLFALKNGTKEANDQVWKLAQSVCGWGKIAAVEQLEATTSEIKQWLLTKGYENNIMNEYAAYECAVKGELDVALEEETISKELYDHTNFIIQALLNEIMPKGIDDYLQASNVLSRFIFHAKIHCKTLEDYYPLTKISDFLKADPDVWEERLNHQWEQQERTAMEQAIAPFINDSKWLRIAVDALEEGYNWSALEIARFYGLDVTPKLFKQLEKSPTNPVLYAAIMETNHCQHIKELCIFAEAHLSLLNLSDDERACLACIVQDLQEHEGIGLQLIQAALESDESSLQYDALNALEGWAPSMWQQLAIQDAIKKITMASKDKETRQYAKQFLKK